MRFLLLLLTFALPAVEVPASVHRVIDGDTIVTDQGTVRLRWIDTPESRGNRHGSAMPEGRQATAFLAGLMPAGTAVTLQHEGDALPTDRYGRLLALVLVATPAEGQGAKEADYPSDLTSRSGRGSCPDGWALRRLRYWESAAERRPTRPV